ncbi:hypothetical protein HY637_05250 [Candidatus Woesearchaeota archaeon]|nr:hypothetical protein [Candidatus Woesearchaeota archaeon]
MISKLQQIFHSITKSLEILYVIENTKPCARILVPEEELGKVANFLNENKLNYSVSDFKVLKQTLQSDFYSDKSVKVSKNDPRKGYFFAYISKNKDFAEKAKIAEEKNNHFELGSILGYPKCCCDFFEKNFDENNTDLTLKTLKYSTGFEFSFYTNIAARHFDVALLSHFPHSFNCEESIKIAKNHLKILEKHSRQLAVMFSGILKSAVIYTMEEGIFLLRNYEKNGNEILYSNVLNTAKSKLYFLLNSNNKLQIIDKNNFFVNGIKIQGGSFGVMAFS